MAQRHGLSGQAGSPPPPPPEGADLYRELFERSPDAILIIEGEQFVDCNQATARMLRFASREDLVRRFRAEGEDRLSAHPGALSPARQPDGQDSFEKANEMIRIAFDRGHHRFEWDHLRADGEIFPVEVQLTAFSRGARRLLHVTWREIAKRRRLEAELRQAQKLEAIGKLAGGVAHDFNNLLLVIQGHAAMLADEIAAHPELRAHVTEIEKAGRRAAALTQQMLAFSRLQVLRTRTLDLGELVDDLLSLLRPLAGDHIEIHAELPAVPVPVKADPSQLEQVLVNLVTNARDAMPHGGRLTIRLDTAEALLGKPGGPPLPAARLSVTDSGEGMPAAVAEKAFDPFFTTKEPGQGTGLGLATVHGIVMQSGGTVEIHSEVGRGTEIRVHLPRSQEPIEAPTAPVAAPALRGASGTVLLVEDEDGVRRLLDQALREAGFTVFTARNGEEGLATLLEHDGAFDALVSDVVMPRLGGPELARRVRADYPTVAILLMSGFIRDSPVDLAAAAAEFPLLEKPFKPSELLAALQEVLQARG